MSRFLFPFLVLTALLTGSVQAESVEIFHPVLSVEEDGTIQVEGIGMVRLSGLYGGDLLRPHVRRELRRLLEGQTVRLEEVFIDRRERRVAHVWRADGLWVQEALVGGGWARPYLVGESAERDEALLALAEEARRNERGGWRSAAWTMRKSGDLQRGADGPALVEGMVARASEWKGTAFLNFGADSRTAFTVRIPRPMRTRLKKRGIDPLELEGKTLRVWGWLSWKGRAEVVLRHPAQLEIRAEEAPR